MSDKKNNKQQQYDKQFKYVPPEKEKDDNILTEKYKKLSDNVLRLDGNMKSMHVDNRTLRKHVMDQSRQMKAMNDRINSLNKEIYRLHNIIEMMLKNDDDDFKGKKR